MPATSGYPPRFGARTLPHPPGNATSTPGYLGTTLFAGYPRLVFTWCVFSPYCKATTNEILEWKILQGEISVICRNGEYEQFYFWIRHRSRLDLPCHGLLHYILRGRGIWVRAREKGENMYDGGDFWTVSGLEDPLRTEYSKKGKMLSTK